MHLCFAGLPPSYSPSPDLLTKLVPYQFSERLTYYFCAICGTHMLGYVPHGAQDSTKGESWDIFTGTLEAPLPPMTFRSHEFIADTLDGGFADFLPTVNDEHIPRFAQSATSSEQLPTHWSSPARRQVTAPLSDRLHCHCKCGGVEFWIARPSERSYHATSDWPDMIIPHHSKMRRDNPSPWWLRDDGKKFLAGVCACNSCRLDTGMEWIEWTFIPAVDISLDLEGDIPFSLPFGTLQAYESSPGITRYHCGACGASAFFHSTARTGLLDVAAGLSDAPEGARAETWLEWRTERLSYREDAIDRAKDLTLALEHGLLEFGQRKKTTES